MSKIAEKSAQDKRENQNPHLELSQYLQIEWMDTPLHDLLSHWILRMCYTDNKDHFVNLEGHLFKVRMEKLKKGNSEQFEKKLLDILTSFYHSVGFPIEEKFDPRANSSYLEVPFEDAVSMMAEHKVVIRGGIGIIPSKHYSNLIRLLFGRNLRQEMNHAGQNLKEQVEKDDRLKTLIQELPKVSYGKDYTKVDYGSRRGNISIHDINPLAAQHFPLCMKEVACFKPRCTST